MQQIVRGVRAAPAVPAALGLSIAAIGVAGFLLLAGTTSYEVWGAVVLAPALVLLTLPMLARQARREGDPQVFRILVAALIAKLVAALPHYYVLFHTYGGLIDASDYDATGRQLAERFARGDFHTGLPDLVGTNFVKLLTGIIDTVIGPTTVGGFLVFSWIGFLGLFFLYRAYLRAVPEGRLRTYRRFLFFLPSCLYWSSAIGKEAWMLFAIGLVALGASTILTRASLRGLMATALGLGFAALVRPHVAGMLAIGIAAGYLVRRPSRRLGHIAPVAKALGIAALVVLSAILVVQTTDFLKRSNFETDRGIAGVLQEVNRRTGRGGSVYSASIVESPETIPIAVGTVLFRPFVLEADNVVSLLAALESLFLLFVFFRRIRWLGAAVKSVRRQPYVLFAGVFALAFALSFASFANFGTLVRERVQVLPFFLVLLSVPPPTRRVRSDRVLAPFPSPNGGSG